MEWETHKSITRCNRLSVMIENYQKYYSKHQMVILGNQLKVAANDKTACGVVLCGVWCVVYVCVSM